MRKVRSAGSPLRAALITVFTLLIIFGGLFATSMFDSTAKAEGGVSNVSLYERASELTREFATAIAPGSPTRDLSMAKSNSSHGDSYMPAGNAGALLGYAEMMSDDEGIVGWLMSSYTQSSATISYDQLKNVVPMDSGKNPFEVYASYGEALTAMGLVQPIRTGGSAGRIVATGLTMIVYLLANAAPFIFKVALMLLVFLNPFRLFETVLYGTAEANLGPLSGIAEWLGGLYSMIQDFSLTVLLPLLLVLTILGILFVKGTALKKSARYFVRVLMIFAGLPLIGSTYTGVVESLEGEVSVGAEYADYLVLSSYVDFENWVTTSRLAPPENHFIENPRMGGDADSMAVADRSMVLDINANRAGSGPASDIIDRYGRTDNLSNVIGNDEAVTKSSTISGDSQLSTSSNFTDVMSILRRHAGNAAYSSSDFDGLTSSQIEAVIANASGDTALSMEEDIVHMFALSASDSRTWKGKWLPFSKEADKDWLKAIEWNGDPETGEDGARGLFTPGLAEYENFRFTNFGYNIYNNGTLNYDIFEGGYNAPLVGSYAAKPVGTTKAETAGGLSTIAMYNFLNTTFSDTGLTVFSPGKTAGDNSRDTYSAVAFAGNGVTSWMMWFENLVIMLCLSTLSIAYGVIMINAAITSIPRIISGVFGTAMGSIAFITKLLISVMVLIIQVFGIIFLYLLSENLIMTLLLNFNEIIGNIGGGTSSALAFATSLLLIVVISAVTYFMIKNANIFKQMMEEFISNAINKLMGMLDTSTGGKGVNLSDTTGGRIQDNGKIADEHAAPERKSVADILGDTQGIESRREQANQERYPDAEGPGFMDKVASRARTAKELAGAHTKDVAKGSVGMKGKSYEREMGAKDRSIGAIAHKSSDDAPVYGKAARQKRKAEAADRKAEKQMSKTIASNEKSALKDFKSAQRSSAAGADVTASGQQVDENGNVITDSNGNAIDAQGNAISPAMRVGEVGNEAMVDENGTLLDIEGDAYLDESGRALRQDEDGMLIDEYGNYADIDADGNVQAIEDIPGHSGEPVNALEAAQSLDDSRFDSEAYADMQASQAQSHYGIDSDGNIVGSDGEAVGAVIDGQDVTPTLDEDGFVVDEHGERIDVSDMAGTPDARGFEEVQDPITGETHMRHKGDSAMKGDVISDDVDDERSLTSLADEANIASDVAERADERLESLVASNAPPYAIEQAKRFSDQAKKNALTAQNNLSDAMGGTESELAKRAEDTPVSASHVEGASHSAQNARADHMAEKEKLKHMKSSGASPEALDKQKAKVDTSKNKLKAENDKLARMKASKTDPKALKVQEGKTRDALAKATSERQTLAKMRKDGSSPHDVNEQHERVVAADTMASESVSKLADMKSAGAPAADIKAQEKIVASAKAQEKRDSSTLQAMQKAPASEGEVRKQQKVVEKERQRAQEATTSERNMRQAHKTGRSLGEVTAANAKVDKQERLYGNAVSDRQRAIDSGAPANVIAQHDKTVNQRAESLTQAQQQAEKVQSPPKGTGPQLDRARAVQKQAYNSFSRSQQKLNRLQESSGRVAPEKINAAKTEVIQAQRQYNRASDNVAKLEAPRQRQPKSGRTPNIQRVPPMNPKRSYTTLAADGITSYKDYSSTIKSKTAALEQSKAELRREEQRHKAMMSPGANRPKQVVQESAARVQKLKEQVTTTERDISSLKDNSQGLLKNGGFKPKLATRPIRENGGAIVNKMVNMQQSQRVYEKYAREDKQGTLSDAGRRQMKQLQKGIGVMRKDLIASGIREDYLKDAKSIKGATAHMQASWAKFIDGDSEDGNL